MNYHSVRDGFHFDIRGAVVCVNKYHNVHDGTPESILLLRRNVVFFLFVELCAPSLEIN